MAKAKPNEVMSFDADLKKGATRRKRMFSFEPPEGDAAASEPQQIPATAARSPG
jgi:hypothetical protein